MSEKQQQQNQSQNRKPKPPKPLAPLAPAPETEHERAAPQPVPELLRNALQDPAGLQPDTLRGLQQTLGNGFTERVARQQQGTGQKEGATPDGAARETVAAGVAALQAARDPVWAQRAADELAGQEIEGGIEQEIDQKRGSGQKLPEPTQQKMEGVLGSDLSDVRVHTDPQANELSQAINARAFTTGADIFFGSGEYNTGSQTGEKLIAHELTHVVQQGAGRKLDTQRQPTGEEEEADQASREQDMHRGPAGEENGSESHPEASGSGNGVVQTKMRVSHPEDEFEKEAEQVSDAVVALDTPGKEGPQKSQEQRNSPDIARGGGGNGGSGQNNNNHNKGSVKRLRQPATPTTQQARASAAEFGRALQGVTDRPLTQPGDRHEREAERNARAGTAGKIGSAPLTPASPGTISPQRNGPTPNEFRAEISRSLEANLSGSSVPNPATVQETVQRSVDGRLADMETGPDSAEPDRNLDRELASRQGGGQPLKPSTQKRMEAHFDADFSRVRVHTDQGAARLSRSLDAQAFTTGPDIYFDEGGYRPGTSAGDKLLVHELTHVMQQGAAPTRSEPAADRDQNGRDSGGQIAQRTLRVSHPDDPFEKEADAMADAAVARHPSSSLLRADSQAEDEKPVMVKPGGEVDDNPSQTGGADNSPAQGQINEQAGNDDAAGAAGAESKKAQEKSNKSGEKAKSGAEKNAANARGNKGKSGKGANNQKSEEQNLPGDATANLQQLPAAVDDVSGTEAKVENLATGAENLPLVPNEAVLPTWSDLAAGTIQLARNKRKGGGGRRSGSNQEPKGSAGKNGNKEAAVEESKKQGGKKQQEPKEIKPKPKQEKGKKGGEEGAKKAQKVGQKEKEKGGGEKPKPKVTQVPKAPPAPPAPELPRPSETGGIQPLGSTPDIDTDAVGTEIAWMQSPRMQKVSEMVSSGMLAEKVQASEQNGAQQADGPATDPKTESAVARLSEPTGFERRTSGLLVPEAPETQTTAKPEIIVPNRPGSLRSNLGAGTLSRAERAGRQQGGGVPLNGLNYERGIEAITTTTENSSDPHTLQRRTDNGGGGGSGMEIFQFAGNDLASLFMGGGGAQALNEGGLDMGMQAALAGAGGGGFAEGMLSSTGTMDLLGSVGMNTTGAANDLPLPDAGFAQMAADQFSPTAWFDQTVGGLGESANAVAGGFASVGSEGTVWGKIAATMEALGTVIDLISQILDIVSLILTIIDALCTVMISLAPIVIMAGLVPIFPFAWTPGVFSPIKSGVASVSRILDKIADVLGIVGDVLLQGAAIFRILDMLETLADPKPSEERQNAMDESMLQFAEQSLDIHSQTLGDDAGSAADNRNALIETEMSKMSARETPAAAGETPPEPPAGLPPLPPEATPDAMSELGANSGDLAAKEQGLLMMQEEITNLIETGMAGMESIEATRDTTAANRKGIEAHKEDMGKKKQKQQSMKKSTTNSKGTMGKGKSKGASGKALMGVVMPLLMPLLQFGMSWGAGGNADTGEAQSGMGDQASGMASFFQANNVADVLSTQRIIQTTMLIGKATKMDEKLGDLDAVLGEKFDIGMNTIGMLTQDAGLIGEQLGLVQSDRQAMGQAQENSAQTAMTWVESSRMAREEMFGQLEMGLGTIEANNRSEQ